VVEDRGKGMVKYGGVFLILMAGISTASAFDLSLEAIQPIEAVAVDKDKAALGKQLFFDTRLSHDNSISCAHCHTLDEGGADGLKHSFGVEGREGSTNSPTVFNAALNFAQFWDGRAATLEEQINGPVLGHVEMASSWSEVIGKLKADTRYQNMADLVCKNGLDADCVRSAIAEFERTLITPNSRFDEYLRGDEHAIDAVEKHGYALFKSYGCVACHQGRNVGGNLYQTLGVMANYFDDFPSNNPASLGRFNVTQEPDDMHRFKVPSLRLAVLTAPYFHNGSQKDLYQTIHTMGKYQLGRTIPDKDISSIIRFLYTLPGEYNGVSLEPNDRNQLNFDMNESKL